MSAFSGSVGGSGIYRVSGEMLENDSDDIEDSFIIIPREPNEEEDEDGTVVGNANAPKLVESIQDSSVESEPVPVCDTTGTGGFKFNRDNLDEAPDHAVFQMVVDSMARWEAEVAQDPSASSGTLEMASDLKKQYESLRDFALNQSAISTAASNISTASEVSSLEEVNATLNELSMENRKLKDVLTEKNEKMKKDLEAYRNLQETMVKMSSLDVDHKAKCEERIALIEQLRAEKQFMKEEMDLLKQKHDSDIRKHGAYVADLYRSNHEVIMKMELEMQATKESHEREIIRLSGNLNELQKLLETAQSDRNKLVALLKRNEDELTAAKSFNAIAAAEISELQKVKDTLHQAFEDSKVTIDQLNMNRIEKTREAGQLVESMKERDARINDLQDQVNMLYARCTEFGMTSSRRESDASDLNGRLKVIAEQLKQELGIRENELLNERRTLARANELLAQKDDQISSLQTQLALFRVQQEELQLYKDQMEEYRANFEAERKDLEEIKGIKDGLAKEVAKLKAELTKKSTELENLHKTHIAMAQQHLERVDSVPDRSSMSSTGSASSSSKPSGMLDEVKGAFNFVRQELFGTDDDSATRARKSVAELRRLSSASSSGSSIKSDEAPARTSAPAPVPQQQFEFEDDKKCPICGKKFATENALVSHASHCGEPRPRSGFLFP